MKTMKNIDYGKALTEITKYITKDKIMDKSYDILTCNCARMNRQFHVLLLLYLLLSTENKTDCTEFAEKFIFNADYFFFLLLISNIWKRKICGIKNCKLTVD